MKNMHIRYAALLLFVLLSASTSSFAQTVLEQKISAISAIKEIRPLETSEFSEKYVTYFTQPLDHRHPEKGSFRQRVIVSHAGFDRPTVIVTEGYGAAYALRPQYREELSKLLNANMIFVEYRYFLESTPEPKDWQYLTAENSQTTYMPSPPHSKASIRANGSPPASAKEGRLPFFTALSIRMM